MTTPKIPPLVEPIRMKRKRTLTQWLRLGSQVLFLGLTGYAIIRHRIGEAQGLAGPANGAPSVDAVSPMGGLESLGTYLTSGRLVGHVQTSDFVLLIAALLLVLLLGSAFCGWICPFGAIQEWLYQLRTRLIPRKINLPARLDNLLTYGRYFVLAWVLLATFQVGDLVFADYCPWRAAWHLGGSETLVGGTVILGLVVVGGLLIERAWCRYACPLGAVLGLFNKVAPVKLKRTEPTCSACGLCSRKCPVGIPVSSVESVTDTTCNRCLECVDGCPKPGVLAVRLPFAKPAQAVKGSVFGLLAVAIFGGVILLSQATGLWHPTASAEPPAASAETGQLDPLDIKGWRTLKEISDLWGVPENVLYRELGLDPAEYPPATTRIKDLEGSGLVVDGEPLDMTQVRDLVIRWQKGELKE